jgi:hypothetical protein
MNFHTDDIVKALDNIATICREQNASDPEWTRMTKEAIVQLAEDSGYTVRSSISSRKKSSEWLYDITILEVDEGGNILRLPLIAESEWKPSLAEICYDFDKLLQSKADMKIMVFQQKSKENVEEVFQKLSTRLSMFKMRTEQEVFLLFGLDWSQGVFFNTKI